MKLILRLIKIAIIFLMIGDCFYLLINKTFMYKVYKTNIMDGSGIPINRFMYVVDNDETLDAKFYTILPGDKLESKKKDYLDSIDSCYGKYYYDKNNNVTITNYEIIDKNYYRLVKLGYVSDNYCSSDYKLSDMWVYDYINKSGYISGDIAEKAMTNLVDDVYRGKRVEPIIKTYTSKYTYKVNCENSDEKYTLIFSDFSENELLVKKEVNGNTKFAVYEIENVVDYLEDLR